MTQPVLRPPAFPDTRAGGGSTALQKGSAWLDRHHAAAILLLVSAAIALRALLVVFSPTPFGYVWDFYHEGVRVVYNQKRLPLASDCWQCYHPPFFYVAGWVFYAWGRWMSSHPSDAIALRWLGALSLISAAISIYYGYRLLRLFRCRGVSLTIGLAVLLVFPCLFISSYGPEADILLTAILCAFLYYLTRYYAQPARATFPRDIVRLGLLAGLAAATKYSGLVAITSAGALVAAQAARGPDRLRTVRNGIILLVVCTLVGGWKYADNIQRYGTPLYSNGTAAKGFSPETRRTGDHYQFTTLRLADLRRILGPQAPPGRLTQLPVYASVITTLHALAWSDMGFFSIPTRYGDSSEPYPRKLVPADLIMTVVILGFVPEILAVIGLLVTIRRRIFQPLFVMSVVSMAAYLWWFLAQEEWALKTKYILFLLPAFVVYMVAGLSWLNRRVPILGLLASVLMVALVLVTHVYLYAFAVGKL
jgi:4-amino-4-deoxy-L-arabinose transferase-like glycosyltransferase